MYATIKEFEFEHAVAEILKHASDKKGGHRFVIRID